MNLERLFIVDIYEDVDFSTITNIMSKIIKKYNKQSKSPPPIFYLRKLSKEHTNKFKRDVYDKGVNLTTVHFLMAIDLELTNLKLTPVAFLKL